MIWAHVCIIGVLIMLFGVQGRNSPPPGKRRKGRGRQNPRNQYNNQRDVYGGFKIDSPGADEVGMGPTRPNYDFQYKPSPSSGRVGSPIRGSRNTRGARSFYNVPGGQGGFQKNVKFPTDALWEMCNEIILYGDLSREIRWTCKNVINDRRYSNY
ncbi:hypothetical protein BB560_001239 [Smittium megazygosporum]|uniref:Uncharacterized protein n=1 Tax=Smittium megazygosporum TaxID=133381 RepID=A0A2T9ZI36_9FUNG|nr:hypothetical protein BB560_001239 [Smittium megazygosporum]